MVSPYIGVQFGGGTNLVVGRAGAERDKFTFGSSVGLLTEGIVGVEADVGFVSGFFEGPLVRRGPHLTTVMGNVIVAVPLEKTQYGLRPYLTGGVGWMHASGEGSDPIAGTLIDLDLFAFNAGGGLIGPISPNSSVRFDLRYFRNLSSDDQAPIADGTGVNLSFWRGTVGLTFRF